MHSGRFVLRTGAGLHASLRRGAEAAGLSLNEYCLRRLLTGGVVGPPVEAAAAQAAAMYGEEVVGVLVFGSWARGDTVEESDIDLLIVVEARLALTRELYEEWDRGSPAGQAPRVEPHFVHLPEPEPGLSGFWAEVATDGIVVFEQGLRISRALGRIRRRIADGELVRRWAHGHPYWTEAA